MATVTATAPGPRVRARQWFAGFGERDTWAAFAFLSPCYCRATAWSSSSTVSVIRREAFASR